jgi:hypothetical protein
MLDGLTGATDAATQEAAQGGKDVASTYGDASLDKLKQETPKFQTAMSQGVEQGLKDTNQIASQGGRDVGNALATGIQGGVQSQAHNIASTAAQTVRDAIAAARDAAGAHSPSRRMMDLGDDMGLGLIQGLSGRQGDAEQASARLVHIPSLNPTSAGGVTGRRAFDERAGPTTVVIEHLELPSVTDPQSFISAMERMTASNGVASGRP